MLTFQVTLTPTQMQQMQAYFYANPGAPLTSGVFAQVLNTEPVIIIVE
jgi:hypothetical protein